MQFPSVENRIEMTMANADAFSETTQYGSRTASGNPRLFTCSQCSRAFTREEHLSRHVFSTHNKLKPFICGMCSRPFARRDLLLRHAKNLHGGSEQAVSRIRKSYRKNVTRVSSEEQSDDAHSQKLDSTGESIDKQDLNGHQSEESDENVDMSSLKSKRDSSEKQRMKMSVNMLVS